MDMDKHDNGFAYARGFWYDEECGATSEDVCFDEVLDVMEFITDFGLHTVYGDSNGNAIFENGDSREYFLLSVV